MSETILMKLFAHNNWANLQIIEACAALSEAQLDAEPDAATRGSIRQTLAHLVEAQQNYLAQLKGHPPGSGWQSLATIGEMVAAAGQSGEGLQALARDESSRVLTTKFHRDGFLIEPWVVMVQALNHAAEHREQIKSMISALGLTPPRVDGWEFGRVTQSLIQTDK